MELKLIQPDSFLSFPEWTLIHILRPNIFFRRTWYNRRGYAVEEKIEILHFFKKKPGIAEKNKEINRAN